MKRWLCLIGLHGQWKRTLDDPRGMGWECLTCGKREDWL